MTSSPKYASCLAAISPLTPAPNTTTLNGILPANTHTHIQGYTLSWMLNKIKLGQSKVGNELLKLTMHRIDSVDYTVVD